MTTVSAVSGMQPTTQVEFTGTRRANPAGYRRNEELDADTVDISTKKKKKKDGEKNFFESTIETVGKAAKSFVDITVNALARAASDAVVDKAIDKMGGKK